MTITLSGINIYPVKSLGGISLKQSHVLGRGLAYDRRFLVVDEKGDFYTQRDHPKMATVWVDIDDGKLTLAAPDLDTVEVDLQPASAPTRKVRVWSAVVDAHDVSPEADRFLSGYLGLPCKLVYMPDVSERAVNPKYAQPGNIVSFADAFPYLVISEASLADLNARLEKKGTKPLPMNRFRPNLVVKGCEPYAEDTWKEFRIGDAVFKSVKDCGRCQVTTTDQATGEVRGPEPLATLVEYRDSESGPLFGQNLVATKFGEVRVGDAVTVIA
jgi:uncharacterized protein YcbX